MDAEMKKPYWKKLNSFLASQKHKKIFPPQQYIFNALQSCPPEKIKVVVLGQAKNYCCRHFYKKTVSHSSGLSQTKQDPYHDDGQAHGLAFSVLPGVAIPPSLRNMFKELDEDPEVKFKKPSHGNLQKWADQGVLLLNTCLTVEAHKANSHQKQGWEDFTQAIVNQLNKK